MKNDADYRLIRKDIAAVVTQIEQAPERDAVVVAKEAKAMYRGRLELTLKRASLDLDSGLTVGPVKAAAYRAFLDAATRLASLDGVITEPKIPVEVEGDAIVKGMCWSSSWRSSGSRSAWKNLRRQLRRSNSCEKA